MFRLVFTLYLILGAVALGSPFEDSLLKIGQIYDQGSSQWCWAYSSFHTLRTYYGNLTQPSDVARAWQAALASIDSAQGFENFMSTQYNPAQNGNPLTFFKYIREQMQLPQDQVWTGYQPYRHSTHWQVLAEKFGDHFAPMTLPSVQILSRVADNLQRGIPSVFCNQRHCRMIYGDRSDGGQIQSYAIADSLGGRTYAIDANEAESELDLVVTVP